MSGQNEGPLRGSSESWFKRHRHILLVVGMILLIFFLVLHCGSAVGGVPELQA